MADSRYGIGEWYGRQLLAMSRDERALLADVALAEDISAAPNCPFRTAARPCSKHGGVCSLQKYAQDSDGGIGEPEGSPVIVCPNRFQQHDLPVVWMADIVGFDTDETKTATEVAFMHGTRTGKAAGKIDLVVAREVAEQIEWHGLEIQAVYFSGRGMRSEFERLRDATRGIGFPDAVRRPDWRSSSAKRLMPQLQIKVPTLRRWGAKMAVVVDRQFFDSIGGASASPSQDLGDGDIIWMVVDLVPTDDGGHELARSHWEVLTLERSCEKLLAAETIQRDAFLQVLRNKLST